MIKLFSFLLLFGLVWSQEALPPQTVLIPEAGSTLNDTKPTVIIEVTPPLLDGSEKTRRPPRTTRKPVERRRTRRPTQTPSRDFDSLLFVQQWPPAFRKENPRQFNENAKQNLEEWTIHGLWPDTTNRCRSEQKFDIVILADLLSVLSQRWPSFSKQRSSEQFWRYQWGKHGTCSDMTVSEYFSKALELSIKYPITTWLSEGSVIPTVQQQYSIADFTKALGGYLKPSQYFLKCKDVREGADRKHLLREVNICFAKDGSALSECKRKSNCKEKFYYLPVGASGKKYQ